MLTDLSTLCPENSSIEADICIVGGGTSGLFLAQRLLGSGLKVVLLEEGDMNAKSPIELNKEILQTANHYKGASSGRSFGLGGTSVLWGGQLIPPTDNDLTSRDYIGMPALPLNWKTLRLHYDNVLQIFGLDRLYEGNGLLPKKIGLDPSSFEERWSRWIPFRFRNQFKAFGPKLLSDANTQILVNAKVVELNYQKQVIESLTVKSKRGCKIILRAKNVVFAAGAIETTRLLLELDEKYNGLIKKTGGPLGEYFCDHISMTVGEFRIKNHNEFTKIMSPVFVNGYMQSRRFETTAGMQRRNGVASSFAHVFFKTNKPSVLNLLRDIFRWKQGKIDKLMIWSYFTPKFFCELFAVFWYRLVKKTLWQPKDVMAFLQIDVEQVPEPLSAISLNSKKDRDERKLVSLNWQISDEDRTNIKVTTKTFVDRWYEANLDNIAEIKIFDIDDTSESERLYDVYHPVGTIRMGDCPQSSVVNQNLRVWGVENLWVSSTAVFPTTGSANPGLIHLALTDRLSTTLRQNS